VATCALDELGLAPYLDRFPRQREGPRCLLLYREKTLNSPQVCERSWRSGDDNRTLFVLCGDPSPDMRSAELLIVLPFADPSHTVSKAAFGLPMA
jgi:hypothetical protein